MTKGYTVDRALLDSRLLGAALGDPATWVTWIAVLKGAFGRELNDEEREVFAAVAGNRAVPTRRVRELWAAVSRRAGKSRVAAALAVYFAAFVTHKLAAGEVPMVLVVAGSREQSKSVLGFVKGFLEASPVLRKEVANVTANEVALKNGVVIAVHANSFRTIRGRTLVAAILDEISYWFDVGERSDAELYRAVLPSLATVNGMLVAIGSPYRKLGLLYQKHRDHYGIDGDDVLVVAGGSETFNPSLAGDVIAAQAAADPQAAQAEWYGQFRADISTFLADDLIDGAVDTGRPLELPPRPREFRYFAFTDPAGGGKGANADSYTLSICHLEGERRVVDVVRGTKGKYDPQFTTAGYAILLREYGINRVVGDRYAAEWCAGAWRVAGITYEQSELTKSEIFLEVEPLFVRGLVQLPDHPTLLREARLLEKRAARSGREDVGHPRGGHDDHVNAVCGALWRTTQTPTDVYTAATYQQIMSAPKRQDAARVLGLNGERAMAMQARARDSYFRRIP